MSLVVFPFKSEAPDLVLANVATAARCDAVTEVWAIASSPGGNEAAVRSGAAQLARQTGKQISVLLQERIGSLRPGKGDAMNTAIRLAAGQAWERVHFYDADITNFDASWIEGAESAADKGFGVVRHRFPRAATDAMITWMITRPALARLFPGTFLPRLNQPLGGELLLTRPALKGLAESEPVRNRSDWGIDTLLTYSTSVMGLGVYEHHVADGKRHTLYGSLDELRDMVLECLDAVSSLSGLPQPPPGSSHASDPPAPVPDDLKTTVAYDIAGSTRLLDVPPSGDELRVAARLPGELRSRYLEAGSAVDYMDAGLWRLAHSFLMDNFRLGDPGWEALAFRLWSIRVLAYTKNQARAGFESAMEYLERTIVEYEAMSSG